MLHSIFPRVSKELLPSTPESLPGVSTSILLILQMRKLNSERLSGTYKALYLFKWRCEFYANPKSVPFPFSLQIDSYIFLHKLDSDGSLSINHVSGGDSLYGTAKTNSNYFKMLRLDTGTSDGESYSQVSSILDWKSNFYLFI